MAFRAMDDAVPGPLVGMDSMEIPRAVRDSIASRSARERRLSPPAKGL